MVLMASPLQCSATFSASPQSTGALFGSFSHISLPSEVSQYWLWLLLGISLRWPGTSCFLPSRCYPSYSLCPVWLTFSRLSTGQRGLSLKVLHSTTLGGVVSTSGNPHNRILRLGFLALHFLGFLQFWSSQCSPLPALGQKLMRTMYILCPFEKQHFITPLGAAGHGSEYK